MLWDDKGEESEGAKRRKESDSSFFWRDEEDAWGCQGSGGVGEKLIKRKLTEITIPSFI